MEIHVISVLKTVRVKMSVYFNIRGEGSVIQTSLRGGECNLLFFKRTHISSLMLKYTLSSPLIQNILENILFPSLERSLNYIPTLSYVKI